MNPIPLALILSPAACVAVWTSWTLYRRFGYPGITRLALAVLLASCKVQVCPKADKVVCGVAVYWGKGRMVSAFYWRHMQRFLLCHWPGEFLKEYQTCDAWEWDKHGKWTRQYAERTREYRQVKQ